MLIYTDDPATQMIFADRNSMERKISFESKKIGWLGLVLHFLYVNFEIVTATFPLLKGTYVIIPSTKETDPVAPFTLSIKSLRQNENFGYYKVTKSLYTADIVTEVSLKSPKYRLSVENSATVDIFLKSDYNSEASVQIFNDKQPVALKLRKYKNEVHIQADLEAHIDYTLVPKITNNHLYMYSCSSSEITFDLAPSARIEGVWKGKTAGGYAEYNHWRNNDQYILTVQGPNIFKVTLTQYPKAGEFEKIGFYVVQTSNKQKRIVLTDKEKKSTAYKSDFVRSLSVCKIFNIDEDSFNEFAIIPCTLDPYIEMSYSIAIESMNPDAIKHYPAIDVYHKQSVFGEWKQETSGGCYKYTSWIDNQQFNLKFNETTTCYAVLSLIGNEQLDIGMYIVKNDTGMKKLISLRPEDMLRKAIFKKRREVCEEIRAEKGDVINIIPCVYEPSIEGAFELHVYVKAKNDVSIANIDKYYTQYTMISSWMPNRPAGCFLFPSWRRNPHYNLKIKNSSPIKVGIVLSQCTEDNHNSSNTLNSEEGEGLYEEIGFYVYKAENAKEKKIILKQSDLLLTPSFSTSREVSGELTISSVGMSSGITIIPATVKQLLTKKLKYEIRVVLENTVEEPLEVDFTKVKNEPTILKFEGEWTQDNGSVVNDTWTSNPYFTFSVTEPDTKVSCLLLQESFVLAGFYICKMPHSFDDPSSVTSELILYKSEFARTNEIGMEFLLTHPGEYIIYAVIYEPNEVGRFSLILHSYDPIQDLDRIDVASQQKARKRLNVIEEILNTERAYVDNLKKINELFMETLLKHDWKSDVEIKTIKKIFSNIPTILTCNIQLYQDLESTIASGKMAIGKVFCDFSNFFRMYAQYCNDFHPNNQLLEDMKKKSEFKKCVEACESLPGANRLSLGDYLIMPVQRIPRYVLLLEQVKSCTLQTDPDYKNIEESLKSIKAVATDINEKKRRADLIQKVVDIQKTLSVKGKESISIAKPARFFMREGKLQYAVQERRISCYGFLFNDLFLITQKKGKRYELKSEVLITSESVCESLPSSCFSMKSLSSSDIVYIFQASSLEERDIWYADICSAIRGQLTRQYTNMRSMFMKNTSELNMQALINS